MSLRQHIERTKMAIINLVAISVFLIPLHSCKNKVDTIASLEDLDSIPTMVTTNMSAIQMQKGKITGSLEAPVMKRFTRGNAPYDIFPERFKVLSYNAEGVLESEIVADKAVHFTGKKEKWEAFGNVVITNHLKQEVMKTDTIYWDKAGKRIFTHCFVTLESPDFFMQGYGMESDERVTNAKILRPFDSYGDFDKDALKSKDNVADTLATTPVDTPVDTLNSGNLSAKMDTLNKK